MRNCVSSIPPEAQGKRLRLKPYISRITHRVTLLIGLRGSLAHDHTARILHVLVAALALWLAAGWVLTIPFAPKTFSRYFSPLVQEASYVTALVLLRLGHFRRASLAYLAGTWIWATLVCFFNGGVHSPGALLYVSLPASAAWLLGYEAAIWTAGACLLGTLVFTVLEMAHLSLPFSQATPLGTWFVILQAVVINAIPVGQIIGRLRETLKNRKDMEEELRKSEERFRLAVQATNDAVWDIDLATGTVSWNETYATLYGRPPETSKSWQWWIDRIHPEDRERTSDGLRSAISGSESTWTCEYRFQRVDGTWAYLYDRAYIARDPAGRAWRVIGAMQDLTQRKRVEAELRESEERFRNIADSAPVIVWVCDPHGALTFTNRFGLEFFGRTMEQDRDAGGTSSLHPDDRKRVASEFSSAVASRRMYESSFRLRRADGEYRWVLAKGTPRFAGDVYIGHIGITTDITELKQSQEQLQAAQKLESLGVLAGGIAHDFNNLLGGIHAEAELVEMDLAAGSASREEIQKIKTAAIRGSEIVRELMIYAGENQKDLDEAVDVSRLVEEMLAATEGLDLKTSGLENGLSWRPSACVEGMLRRSGKW